MIHEDLTFRQIDEHEGYIRGTLHLYGGFSLHVAEYVFLEDDCPKLAKYRYQLMDSQNIFVARWDNAPHHQDVATHPFHRHVHPGTIEPSPAMNILLVLNELDGILGGIS